VIYVIGSGPAGVASAMALLKRGLSVHLLDAGITLETNQQAVVTRLASITPELWNPASLEPIKAHVQASTDGLPRKIAFGSDFPYQQTDIFFPMTREGVHVLPSLARGGLSTVWGAAVLPHRETELTDWPISLRDLEPHYQAVLKELPFSAVRDDLEKWFPLYSEDFDELQLSQQAKSFLNQLTQNKEGLNKEGIYFGRSRLAVRARTRGEHSGCVYCGLCMYGCPYQCIYCSDQTLQSLMQQPLFRYQKDVVVKRLQETSEGVTVFAEHRLTREPLSFSATQVFLAAGILPTTHILLESLRAYNRPIPMAYSQHFMFPLLCSRGESGITQERLQTLSQLFLEIFDPAISAEVIHLQIYTYNDLFTEALNKSILGPFFKNLPKLQEWALGKLLLVQGYLHSRYSDPIQIQLARESSTSPSRLLLRGQLNTTVRHKTKKVLKKLSRNSRLFGSTVLTPWLKISPPGQGFHNVGTFPMRKNPGEFESDLWGRPHGFKKVHVVDAAVLPSAPATTITLTVMANAHRIGTHCDAH
jgi:choline dehydrogenase-like flavoprotein